MIGGSSVLGVFFCVSLDKVSLFWLGEALGDVSNILLFLGGMFYSFRLCFQVFFSLSGDVFEVLGDVSKC